MKLILVRHGQTPANVDGLLDTAYPGELLTDLGHQQAAALVDALADQHITAAFASSRVRTQLTASPLAQARGIPVHVRDGLREISAGDLEMAGDIDSIRAYRRVVDSWADGDLSPVLPGGESGHEVLARFDAVVEEACDVAAPCAALFSHGAVIRCWSAQRGVNVPTGFGGVNVLFNTEIVELDRIDGQWHVLRWAGREFASHPGRSPVHP